MNTQSLNAAAIFWFVVTGILWALPGQSSGQDKVDATDVLRLIGPSHSVKGKPWTRDAVGLVSPTGEPSALVVPVTAPKSYRWTVELERLGGDAGIGLILVVGERSVMVSLDGFGSHISGLSLLDGKTADRNETKNQKAVFSQGKPTTVVCKVSPGSIVVTCYGKSVINWVGDANRLSVDQRYWASVPKDKLAVTVFNPQVRYRIRSMEFSEKAAPAPVPLAWTKVGGAEWGFEVEVPTPDFKLVGTKHVDCRLIAIMDGQGFTVHRFPNSFKNRPASQVLNELQEFQFPKKEGEERFDERFITLQGAKACKEFKLRTTVGGQQEISVVRVALADSGLYLVVHSAFPAADKPERRRFFDSFRILESSNGDSSKKR